MTKMEKECVINALRSYARNQKELHRKQIAVKNHMTAELCTRNICMAEGLANMFEEILDAPCGTVKI